jgi:hypothetical protein
MSVTLRPKSGLRSGFTFNPRSTAFLATDQLNHHRWIGGVGASDYRDTTMGEFRVLPLALW